MEFYASHVPRLLHAAMRQAALLPFCTRVAGSAEGRVLEIRLGSGLNLSLYGPSASEVVGVDPSPALLSRLATLPAGAGRRSRSSKARRPAASFGVRCVTSPATACSPAYGDECGEASAAPGTMRRITPSCFTNP